MEIQLTKGYVTTIDDEDADLSNQKWFAKVGHTGRVYAARVDTPTGQRILRQMHRIILGRKLGRDLTADELPDHIDDDPLNNHRDNLRLATRSQNQYNAKTRPDNKSGYRGVSFHKVSGKWAATIMANNKQRHLGLFETPELAHSARLKAQAELHGEFAPKILTLSTPNS